LTTETLSFATDGQLATSSPTSLSFTVPNGGPFTLDMSQSSQLATNYTVLSASVNGNAASEVQRSRFRRWLPLCRVREWRAVPTYRIPSPTCRAPTT